MFASALEVIYMALYLYFRLANSNDPDFIGVKAQHYGHNPNRLMDLNGYPFHLIGLNDVLRVLNNGN